MTFDIHAFGGSVRLQAEPEGLVLRGPVVLSRRENWPSDALDSQGGWRTAVEIEQLLELGLADEAADTVWVRYGDFESISNEMPVGFTGAWTGHSPFLLKIDRRSDVGRADFQYRYAFILGGRQVHVDRLGYYVQRAGFAEIFLLDTQMYSLIEAMDAFNALPSDQKTPQQSWLTFAKVKGCAAAVEALLDSTLERNDVVIPSQLGLDMREDADGGLTFLPKCAELATERNPVQVFDGVADQVDLLHSELKPKECVVAVHPKFSNLPPNARTLSPQTRFVDVSGLDDGWAERYLHAKLYLFELTTGGNVVVLGSANASAPAWLADDPVRNAEMVVVHHDGEQLWKRLGLHRITTAPEVGKDGWAELKVRAAATEQERDQIKTYLAVEASDGFIVDDAFVAGAKADDVQVID